MLTPTARRIALLTVTVTASGLAWWLWPNRGVPNRAYAPEMADSVAVQTYEPVGWSRTLPEGTVSRSGSLPLHYQATEQDALRAGAELRMPSAFSGTTGETAGARIFTGFCAPCHGVEGHGDGPTIKRGFQPPPSLLTQRARDLKDGQMFHIVTYGQKMMPAQASQLAQDDRWRVIAHIRSMQRRLPVDPPPFGPEAPVTAKSR